MDRLRAASVRLTTALRQLGEAGSRTPCQTTACGDLWFSDSADERSRAVALCRACPVLQPCGEYRDALDSTAHRRAASFHDRRHSEGVWGGRDYSKAAQAPPRRRLAS